MTEEQEQIALFRWAELQKGKHPELSLMFHIPNGGKRNITEAVRFKRAGVKAGVSDIFLPVARKEYQGLFIEMKRADGGKVSDAQKRFIYAVKKQGYAASVCNGWKEAVRIIEEYLTREKT